MGKRIDIANGNGRGGNVAAGGEDARSCRVGRDGDAAAGDGAAQATRDVALPAVAARNPFARAVPSARAAGSGSGGAERLALRKVACAIRELDTFEGVLEFELGERLGGSASSACVRAAACTTVRTPELSRCAVKFIDDRERAENEWFHLTTYRSPLFPAPFLFGRVVSQGADASASLVAGFDAPGTLGEGGRASAARAAGGRSPIASDVPLTSGAPYVIVMELIEGPTLAQLIAEGFGEDAGAAPVEKALEIMSPFAASFKVLSLSFQGFVHRDVKPANIIVGGGACKTRLVDLGVSAHEQDRLQHKHAGATPGFAPLEIERPQDYPAESPVSYCDARIDTYSIAATFYALLTGRPPAVYGAQLRADDLRHDAGTLELMRGQARVNIASKHGLAINDALLDRLMVRAVRSEDARLARHDAGTLELMRGQARVNIASKHGLAINDALLDRLMVRAVRSEDARLAAVLTRGLSRLQEDRPTPAQLFDALPVHYAATLADAVQVAYLEYLAGIGAGADAGADPDNETPPSSGEVLRTVELPAHNAVHLADTPLSDDYRYEGFLGDFHRAVEFWNRGDYEACVPLFEKLAAAGDATAQYNLGVCYRDGLGVARIHRAVEFWNRGDYEACVPLFEKLAAAGDATAQYNLGVCYRDGLGVARNDAMKLALWTRAAEAGNIVAAYNVAVCHERGDGIPAMPEAALMWYRRSAREGFPAAVKWMIEHGEPLEG